MDKVDNIIMANNGSMTLKDLLIKMIDSEMGVNDVLKITFKNDGLYACVEVKITEVEDKNG